MDQTLMWITNALSATASIFVVATFFIYQKQLRAMQQSLQEMHEATQGDKFFALEQFLLDEKMDSARQHILALHDSPKPFANWDDNDRAAARIVCSRFNVAGILAKQRMIPVDVLYESWFFSIRACHATLKEFMHHHRHEKKRGENYWGFFDWLAHEVLSAAKSNQHPQKSVPSASNTSSPRL